MVHKFRNLATLKHLVRIHPIPGMDNIEELELHDGTRCVSVKGNKVGEWVLHIAVGSFIYLHNPHFQSLFNRVVRTTPGWLINYCRLVSYDGSDTPNSYGVRIRKLRIHGVVSNGVTFRVNEFPVIIKLSSVPDLVSSPLDTWDLSDTLDVLDAPNHG